MGVIDSNEICRILVPVDFSEASRVGTRLALSFAERVGALLDFVYVVGPPGLPEWGYAYLSAREAKAREQARLRFPAFLTSLQVPEAYVTSYEAISGGVVETVVARAQELQSDAIVAISHGAPFFPIAAVGAVTEGLARQSPCPLLSFHYDSQAHDVPELVQFAPKKILVPTDFSETSATAFPYAAAIARSFHASLTTLYVAPENAPWEAEGSGDPITWAVDEAKKRLPQVRTTALSSHTPSEAVALRGNPAAEIVDYADARGFDLMVMTTHGHRGFQRLLLGSVAEKVIRHTKTPTFIVRRDP